MKNLLFVIGIVLLALGCGEKWEAAVARANEEWTKGEWTVININCPNVLAKRDDVTKIFRIDTADRVPCRQVQPGWTIYVESSREYAFFPPLLRKVNPATTPATPPPTP